MTTFGAVPDSVLRLFFEVMTEKADQRCSTSWLAQCGQTTLPSSYSASVRVFVNFAWVLGRASAGSCGALVVRKRCVPLRFGAVGAGVLLEALLSNPVKCKRRNGALEARGDNTPTALRAAPASESFILSPNHASRHGCTS